VPCSFHIKPVAGTCYRLARALFGQLQPRFWPYRRVLAEVTLSQQLERRSGLRSCKLRWLWARIPSGLRGTRNVWSAASPQAKSEDVTRLVCANVYGLCWSESLLARMECAALSSPLVRQSRETFPGSGFGECRVRPLCHLLIRQQTWQEVMISLSSLGCSHVGQHLGPILFILGEHGPGYAGKLIR
jgi:hypothetical protein